MKADQIRNYYSGGPAVWLREIAAQLAELNEILREKQASAASDTPDTTSIDPGTISAPVAGDSERINR